MLKKIASITVAMALAMTSFIGCSSKSDKSVSSSTENAETKAEDTKNDEIVTLKYYTIGPEPKDKQMVVDKMNEYLGEKIGVNLDISFIDYGDYNQKSSVMINTGDDFDLMFTCSWAGDYLGNARKGAFLDLTPYLDNVGKDMYDEIDLRFWNGAKIDGKIYAVPNQKEISVIPMWAFKKELVDKYNIPYTEIYTLEDLEPYLKIIKENEPDVVPLYSNNLSQLHFDTILDPVGIEIGDKEFTVKNVYETEETINQLKTLRRYYEAGYIDKDSGLGKNDDITNIFVKKEDGQPYADRIFSNNAGYDIVTNQIKEGRITNDSTTGSMIAVSSNSKYKEKAVEFLNLLNTDSYIRNLINYGIENVHYERIGENQIRLIPTKYEDYNVGYYTLGNLFITDVLDTEPTTKWEEFKKVNDEAEVSSILGFKADNSNITNEIASVNNVISEFKDMLMTGSIDPVEYIKKLNDKLYTQGLQKIIDEVQSQLDEWLKTK